MVKRSCSTLTTDDTYNLEVNLATVEAILANPPANLSISLTEMCNHIFNIQHRSNDGDPLVTPYIPKVIAGLTGFDLGIRTTEPANIAVEVVVEQLRLPQIGKGERDVEAGVGQQVPHRVRGTVQPVLSVEVHRRQYDSVVRATFETSRGPGRI